MNFIDIEHDSSIDIQDADAKRPLGNRESVFKSWKVFHDFGMACAKAGFEASKPIKNGLDAVRACDGSGMTAETPQILEFAQRRKANFDAGYDLLLKAP